MEIPFILVRKIEKLRFMAFLGVSGIMVFVTTFVIYYIFKVSDPATINIGPDMALFPTDWFEAIASIPNLLLALAFHMNFFPVYKGMKNGNDRKMANATFAGIFICAVFYLLIGVLGYHLVYTVNGMRTVSPNFL
jgi:amino acid permease